MTKLYPYLVAVLIIGLNSCKKDNQSKQAPVSIVGKWYVTSFSAANYQNDVKGTDFSRGHFTTDDFIQFNADGTGICSTNEGVQPAYVKDFIYTRTNSTITIDQDVTYFAQGTTTIVSIDATSMTTHEKTATVIINGNRSYGIEDVTYTK